MSAAEIAARFVRERRRLYDLWLQIRAVETEARDLVRELDRRRDGLAPSRLDLPELRRALDEVER